MAKNETGEFELVLGNKQLLSVFFIVVILLGVFFTMGYIVGRNSTPPTLEATNRKQEGKSPLVVDSPNAPPPSQIPTATEPPKTEDPKPVVREPEPKTDPPKADPPKPDPVKVEAPKPEPPKKEDKAKAEKKQPGVVSTDGPQAGRHYLQVQALPSEQAGVVLEVLRKKGFSATTEPVPNKPGLTRILVGPVTPAAAPEMKDNLDTAGFKGKQSILRKF